MEISGSISSVLTQKPAQLWSISPDDTVFDAIKIMAEKNIGALPVLRGDQLLGMVSERDYTRKVILQGKSSKQTPVREIMSPELVTASPSDTISACTAIMTQKRVRHLPVLEDGKLIGIVSIGDLVKWIISAQAATIEQLEKYVIGE